MCVELLVVWLLLRNVGVCAESFGVESLGVVRASTQTRRPCPHHALRNRQTAPVREGAEGGAKERAQHKLVRIRKASFQSSSSSRATATFPATEKRKEGL